MLKKASIVAALLAASLVAVSPLAFAGEGKDRPSDDRGHSSQRSSEFDVDQDQTNFADDSSESSGLINVSGNDIGISAANCVGNVATGGAGLGTAAGGITTVASGLQTITGLLGAFGLQTAEGTGGGALGVAEGGYAGNECDASYEGGDALLQGNAR